MANAKFDANSVSTLLAVSNADGTTPVLLYADPVTHRLLTSGSGGGGSPGGSSGQMQWNNGGSFDGTSGLTTDGTDVTALDANFFIVDQGDITKRITFQVSGVTTNTTRTITAPDASGTMTLLGNTSTGSGAIVLATSPTLITPTLGVASATTINKVTFTAPASGSTLTIADGKTLTQSNTLTYTGTDGSTVNFGAGGTVLYTNSTVPLTVGSTTIASGANTRILYDNSGVLGEYTITGSGTVVAMATSPNFTTPTTGANGGTGGSLKFFGSTSGDSTVKVAAAAGTATVFQLPADNGTNNYVLKTDGNGVTSWTPASGGGDVVGPSSATDNAVARFDGTTGKLIQNTAPVIIGDSGNTTITIADTTNVKGLAIYANDVTNVPLGLQVGPDSAKVTSSTLVQFNSANGSYSDWSFNVAGGGGAAPFINFQSTGGTLGSPTASATGGRSSIDTYVYNSTPAQKRITNLTSYLDSGTASSENAHFGIKVITGGTLADAFFVYGASVRPGANDGSSLGISGTAFSDLFLASGAVIDFAAGNSVITHSSGILTVSTGDLRVTSAGTNSASVVTVGGTQTLINKSIVASQITTGTFGTGAYTMDTRLTVPQILNTPATISVSSNAGTVTRANRINNFTNSSAATMTITMSTTSATDGDMIMVVILDASAAAQTITWVNTENSTATAPTTSNGSTTLPLTVGFKWNAATSKWRCIASA